MIFLLKPTLLKHIKLFLKRNRGKITAVTPPDRVAQTHPALWEELWNSLEKQAREILGWCKWSSWGILMEPVGKGADFTKSWGCRWEQGCGWGWSRDRLCHPSWYRTCLHLVHTLWSWVFRDGPVYLNHLSLSEVWDGAALRLLFRFIMRLATEGERAGNYIN